MSVFFFFYTFGNNLLTFNNFIMKKYLAEMIGTMVLVLMGCGTAVSLNCGVDPASVVGTAVAFGLAIGLSLILIHLVGIHYTGTSVNPARSIAPAIFEGGKALSELWVFIVGPFVGAALSALVWKVIGKE